MCWRKCALEFCRHCCHRKQESCDAQSTLLLLFTKCWLDYLGPNIKQHCQWDCGRLCFQEMATMICSSLKLLLIWVMIHFFWACTLAHTFSLSLSLPPCQDSCLWSSELAFKKSVYPEAIKLERPHRDWEKCQSLPSCSSSQVFLTQAPTCKFVSLQMIPGLEQSQLTPSRVSRPNLGLNKLWFVSKINIVLF